MKSPALRALVLLNLLLAAGLAWLWFTPQGALRNVHWSEPLPRRADYASMLPALPGPAQPDTGRFIAMLDRPVFSLTRRPPLPPPPPAPVVVEPVDTLRNAKLQGIFSIPGEGGSVIVSVDGKSRRVRLNQALEGWTVSAIDGRNVTLSRAGRTRVLQLQRAAVSTYSGLTPSTTAPTAASTPAAAAARAARSTGAAVPSPSAQPDAADATPRAPLRPVFGGR